MRFVQTVFTTPFLSALLLCIAHFTPLLPALVLLEQYSSVNKHNGKGWAVESTSSVQAVRDLIEVAPELRVI